MRVRDLMSEHVTILRRNDEMSLADDIMQLGRIRHMPVVDDDTDEVIGVVSQRDLFGGALMRALGYGDRARRTVLKGLPVKEVMSTVVQTISPEAELQDAASQMLEHKIGCLPVVDDSKLVGILTEADFVSVVARGDSSSKAGGLH